MPDHHPIELLSLPMRALEVCRRFRMRATTAGAPEAEKGGAISTAEEIK
jgi:hypothetical protein